MAITEAKSNRWIVGISGAAFLIFAAYVFAWMLMYGFETWRVAASASFAVAGLSIRASVVNPA